MDRGNWRGVQLQLTRCCPCISLKTGVLVLGYVNLIYHSFLLILALFTSFWVIVLAGLGQHFPPLEFFLLLPLLMTAHVVYNVLTIVAAHNESVSLLKKSFIFGTVLWIFVIPYSICLFSRLVYYSGDEKFDPTERLELGIQLTVIIMEPIILGYGLLLTRSLKLLLLPESQRIGYIDLDKENC